MLKTLKCARQLRQVENNSFGETSTKEQLGWIGETKRNKTLR
jgi:hypothetical protein